MATKDGYGGSHGNTGWNATAAGAGASSPNTIDTHARPYVTAFGSADGATTITLEISQNGTDFYDGPNQVLAGAGEFHISVTSAARFFRLKSSGAATITATIVCAGE